MGRGFARPPEKDGMKLKRLEQGKKGKDTRSTRYRQSIALATDTNP